MKKIRLDKKKGLLLLFFIGSLLFGREIGAFPLGKNSNLATLKVGENQYVSLIRNSIKAVSTSNLQVVWQADPNGGSAPTYRNGANSYFTASNMSVNGVVQRGIKDCNGRNYNSATVYKGQNITTTLTTGNYFVKLYEFYVQHVAGNPARNVTVRIRNNSTGQSTTLTSNVNIYRGQCFGNETRGINYTMSPNTSYTVTFALNSSGWLDNPRFTAQATADKRPIAVNDTYTIEEGSSVSGNVMNNDTKGDGTTTVINNTQPSNGTVTMNSDGTFTYTPDSDFIGTDTFSYTIQDSDGDTSTATVTIIVEEVPECDDAKKYGDYCDFDGDGKLNKDDLDDDNDGILDNDEGGCETTQTINDYKFVGRASVAVENLDQAKVTSQTYNAWGTSYSNEKLTLPIHLEFKQALTTNGSALFGLLPDTKTQTIGKYNDNGYKFYMSGNNVHGYFTKAWDFTHKAQANELYEIDINENGYVIVKIDGIIQKQFQGVKTDYYLAATGFTNSRAVTYTDIKITSGDSSNCTDQDTDKDGIPDKFDLDSDGDGCFDSIEGNGGFSSNDINDNGSLSGNVNTNGVPNKANGGQSKGVSQDASEQAANCDDTDTDGDGIIDNVDLDDDNDGILDVDENCALISELVKPVRAVKYNGDSWNPINRSIDGSGLSSESIDAVHTVGRQNLKDYWVTTHGSTAEISYFFDENKENKITDLAMWIGHINGNGLGDGPIRDFKATITYDGGKVFETETYTVKDPSGLTDDEMNKVTIFPLGKELNNVTEIKLSILNGWYDSDSTTRTYIPTTTPYGITSNKSNYSILIGEFRGLGSEGVECDSDIDNDGIPNELDLDSDGDGCFDSIEGDGGFAPNHINSNGSLSGNVDENGVPIKADGGQSKGVSQDAFEQAANCDDTDTDGDGIIDNVDLDDDNDGILDIDEGVCIGDRTLEDYNFSGNAIIAVNGDQAGFKANVNSGWRTSYSNEKLTLPIHLEFKQAETRKGIGMFGLIPDTTAQVTTHYNDKGYKFYMHSNGNVYGYFTKAWNFTHKAQADELYEIDIDENGYVTVKIGGETKLAYQGAKTDYYIDATGFTTSTEEVYTNIKITSGNSVNCTAQDTDNDGIPDQLDLDSDGDGCFDSIEGDGGFSSEDINADGRLSGSVDANGVPIKADGGQGVGLSEDATKQAANCVDNTDTDGDGIPDRIDLDDDNDGIPDSVEEKTATNGGDTDGDGIPDSLDLDSDNDGIPDLEESGLTVEEIKTLDRDNDGVIDSSNDVGTNGIADAIEPKGEDGGVDSNAVDYDNDGTSDAPQDTDGDGIPDFQDLDSDNDGVTDLTEGGTNPALDQNNDGKIDNATDADQDGIADVIDDDTSRFGGDESNGAPDTDGDGIKDFRDLDSDDDGINDAEEAGVPDTNGDGMDDTPNESFADGEDLPDSDEDGTPNILEPNGPVITGPDTDQDGIKDSEDGKPEEFGDAPISATTPDYFPRIFTSNTIITEDSESVDFVVMIGEIEGGDSNGTDPIEYVIVKQSELSIDFDTTLTTLNGRTVNNKDWKLEEDDFTYKFIYTGNGGIFAGDSASMVGVNATFTPQSGTKGTYPLKVTIQAGSGGETNSKNNVDIDYIEF
ncbi:non-specific serine/threonine protein kinase [Flavobacteriaceae bacterium UJ101]|nr:non-specific serine/threonine protein kinase [Flavobacteriaceae bacterium UJ101]